MKPQSYTVDKTLLAEDQLVFGAMLGLDIIVLLELLGQQALDLPLTVSLYALASAVPALALKLLTLHIDLAQKYTVDPWYINILTLPAPIISFIGIAAVFWHLAWMAGCIFLVLGIYAAVARVRYEHEVIAVNKESDAQHAVDTTKNA